MELEEKLLVGKLLYRKSLNKLLDFEVIKPGNPLKIIWDCIYDFFSHRKYDIYSNKIVV